MDLTRSERLALVELVDRERQIERNHRSRAIFEALIERLAATRDPLKLSPTECSDLAYRARREIETNRGPTAPQLALLITAFAKLAPGDAPPQEPGRRGSRRH